MKQIFTVILKGSAGAALQLVDVKLSGTDIELDSKDGQVTWKNDGVEIDYTPPLHIFLKCGALHGTAWDINVQKKDAPDPCYKESGKTGDQPGGSQANISIRDVDTKCN